RFRGAGAFFIRRTFEDNDLYKMVFRKYLTFLIREGYTQEFFIEGGRTRTGKILTPKLGMLSAILNAFVQGVRRDLYFVPISIHYGRIPEEEAYKREVAGEEKERESLWALLRARGVPRAARATSSPRRTRSPACCTPRGRGSRPRSSATIGRTSRRASTGSRGAGWSSAWWTRAASFCTCRPPSASTSTSTRTTRSTSSCSPRCSRARSWPRCRSARCARTSAAGSISTAGSSRSRSARRWRPRSGAG